MVRDVQVELEPREISRLTLAAYDQMADEYREDTHTRERSADYALFFRHLANTDPLDLLDVGCGPGRDLAHFHDLGHRAVGLDGSARFVAMAQETSGCLVLHQDLLAIDLANRHFDGIFASASLFHVPLAALPDTLATLQKALRPSGILFTLNPRGHDQRGWSGDRYCGYLRLATWRRYMHAAGLVLLEYEYRPVGLPRKRQAWIASVWRRQ